MIKIELGYYIDNCGNVYTKNKVKMNPSLNHSKGYLKITLWNSKTKKRKQKYLHRLVAENFIPNPNNYKYVNHIDGNRYNNHVSNLEWCTAKHNTNHAVKLGLIKTGEDCSFSKLTQKEVLKIRSTYQKGVITYSELANIYNVSKSHIERIVNNKRWKHI